MSHFQDDKIIRYVNTFTAGQWSSQGKKTAQKNIRRGITRVGKSTSQSIQKVKPKIQEPVSIYVNDQNHNQTNRYKTIRQLNTPNQMLVQRIRQLQSQLILVQKEKIELQRKDSRNRKQKQGLNGLIQSHYITCKDDLDELIKQKAELQQVISNLQQENAIIKINVQIQKQYILQVQIQLNELRELKSKKDIHVDDSSIQTEQENQTSIKLEPYKLFLSRQTFNLAVQFPQYSTTYLDQTTQCDQIQKDSQEMESLRTLAEQFQTQTVQFMEIINKLQIENQAFQSIIQGLKLENHQLKQINQTKQTQVYELKTSNTQLKDQIESAKLQLFTLQAQLQQIKMEYQKNESLSNSMWKKQSFENRIALLQETKDVLSQKIQLNNAQIQRLSQQLQTKNKQNQQKDKQLKYLQIKLVNTDHKMQEQQIKLKRQYQQCKLQLDQLLSYLQRQSQIMIDKQEKISKAQHRQLQCINKQETNQKQTQIQSIVMQYQNRIRKIQEQLQFYIIQLQTHRQNYRQINERKELEVDNETQINRQQKMCLLNKIDDLRQSNGQIKESNNKLNNQNQLMSSQLAEKDMLIQKLRQEVMQLSNEYQNQVSKVSKIKQQNYHLFQNITHLQVIKQEVISQNQTVAGRYDRQLSEMQCQIYHLQSDLRLQIDKNTACERSFDKRIQQIKKDYDLLYGKYMKYKNIAKQMQDKQNRQLNL